MSYMKPIVIAPAGKCPIKLESTDDEDILKWAQEIRDYRSDVSMSNDALKYWVQYSFNIQTPEWKYVRDSIDNIVKDVKRPKHLVGTN